MGEPFSAESPSVFANSAANLVGLAAGNLFGFLAGLITAHALGPAGVGILAVSFGIAEFGRSLSNFTHNPSIVSYHRGAPAATVFGTSLVLKILGTTIFVAIIATVAHPLGAYFDVPWWAILLTSIGLVAGIFQEIGAARFEAENKMVFRNVLVALGPTVALVAVLAFLATHTYTLATAILASIVGTLAMSLGFAIYWRSPWRLRYDRDVARYLLRTGTRIGLFTFLSSSLIWTDTLLISHFLGNSEAGIYQAAFSLTFIMVTASVAIGVALVPVMSRLAGKGESTAAAYQRGTMIAGAIALLVAIGYLALGHVILGFYGSGFESGYAPLLILTIFGTFGALAVPATSVLTVLDRAGTLILVALLEVAINLPLNYVMIQRYGITGAAISTTTAIVVGTVTLWTIVHRTTGAWPLSAAVLREGREAVRAMATRR